MNVNRENLQKLIDWLDAGAPHFIFDMRTDLESYYVQDLSERLFQQVEAKGIGECGTVCCIAGWAAQQMGVKPEHDFVWQTIRNKALQFFGLGEPKSAMSLDYRDPDWFGHPLFNSILAPHDCTPEQAAKAARRVLEDPADPNPWKDV